MEGTKCCQESIEYVYTEQDYAIGRTIPLKNCPPRTKINGDLRHCGKRIVINNTVLKH